jgi:opacity protein-like surface antigen
MKRRVWAAVALVGLLAGMASAGEADFGLRGGYMRFPDAEDGALLGSLFFRTDWREVVYIDASVYYHTEEVATDLDLEFIPIQLSAMLFLLGRQGAISPFVLAGGGVYWSRTTPAGHESNSEFDIGWHLGLGCDIALSDRMFIETDFRYIWLDVDSEGETFADSLADFNHWMAGVGLGFRLGK